MGADNSGERSPSRLILSFLLIVILPVAVGLFLAPRIIPKPKVGLIRLSYDIFGLTAGEITEQLRVAREDPSIEAVVLIINSPGGSASYSEELYLDVLHTREELPVVASVDLLAASGAYYMAAAADEIYAKPTSFVGSIGVVASLPGPVFIEDEVLTTGPYKSFGVTRDGTVRQVEIAKFAFLRAVEAGRGERLRVTTDELSRAEIFSGVQAYEMGLIDGLLSTEEAIKQAAELAGLRDYDVTELYPLAFPDGPVDGAQFNYQPEPVDPARLWARPELPPGLYYRYVTLSPDS